MEKQKVVMKLREILSQSDLTLLTRKLVRKRLEEEMQMDLSTHKWKEILKNEINDFVANHNNNNNNNNNNPIVADGTTTTSNTSNTSNNNNNNNNITSNTGMTTSNITPNTMRTTSNNTNNLNNSITTDSTTNYTPSSLSSLSSLSSSLSKSKKLRPKSSKNNDGDDDYNEEDDNNSDDNDDDDDDDDDDEHKHMARPVKVRKLNDGKNQNTKYDKMIEKSNSNKNKNQPSISPQEKFASLIGDQKDAFQYNAKDHSYMMKLPTPGSKRIIVQKFKGKCYVVLREYYEKNGEQLPGKKGINLTMPQWRQFCESIDEINKYVEKVNRK